MGLHVLEERPPRFKPATDPIPFERRLELDSHNLDDAALAMVNRFDYQLLKGLEFTCKVRPVMTVGTTCSGTDLCVYALKSAIRAANILLFPTHPMLNARVESKFACDTKHISQVWLKEMHDPSPERIFKDVREMGNRSAYDVKSGSQQLVPPCMWFISGFCCTDVSGLNVKANQSRGNIASGTGKTGATFAGACQYIERFRPIFVIMENVPAIDDIDRRTNKSNLDCVLLRLESLGYCCFTTKLCPRWHGVPQRRARHPRFTT